MREILRSEQQEIEKKYELPEGNIIALDENSEIRKRNKDYYQGLREEGIEWPVEIQGSGHSYYDKKEFKVWYPAGDIFLSFAITIHELGHLRQGEIDKRFTNKFLGSPTPKEMKETELHHETEVDAWQRGMDRVKEYCPEEWKEIENKFQDYKKQGKFVEYNNLEDFYEYLTKEGLTISKFNDEFEDNKKLTDLEKGRTLGKMIKGNKLTNDFYTKQEKWRTGEKIDKEFAENLIKKAVGKIAEEKYDNDKQLEKDIKKYFFNLYVNLYKQSPKLFESIRKYKSDGYFHDINQLKRTGKDEFRKQLEKAGKPSEEIEERINISQLAIDDIKKFLEESRLPKEISVYRRISKKTLGKIKSEELFKDSGFVSTSYTLEDVNDYHKSVCIKIIIPSGIKVIDITSALQFTKWSRSSEWENELVIGDNYTYKIKPSDSDEQELILEIIK